MFWTVPKIWSGGECFIIGGGPSLVKQFDIPEDIVKSVREGKSTPSAYSPYLEPLHKKHIIGVNMSYKLGNWIDIMFFGDQSFYKRVAADLAHFPGLKITCVLNSGKRLPNIRCLRRNARAHTFGLTTNPQAVSWNSNSGGAAINVAVHTGVKRIYLLGFDMKPSGDDRHWHKLYGKGPSTMPYKTHLRCFPKIAEDAKKLGIEIINLNPDSQIDSFPKMNIKEVL